MPTSRSAWRKADREHRLAIGPPGHRAADLRHDDPCERHRRGLDVEAAGAGLRLPRVPTGEHVGEQEAAQGRETLQRAKGEHDALATEPLRRCSERGRGGRLNVPGSERSAPRAIAGSWLVPRSIASTCMTTSGSGTAPPEMPHTRNAARSPILEEK
jgi:hypothetical protein